MIASLVCTLACLEWHRWDENFSWSILDILNCISFHQQKLIPWNYPLVNERRNGNHCIFFNSFQQVRHLLSWWIFHMVIASFSFHCEMGWALAEVWGIGASLQRIGCFWEVMSKPSKGAAWMTEILNGWSPDAEDFKGDGKLDLGAAATRHCCYMKRDGRQGDNGCERPPRAF